MLTNETSVGNSEIARSYFVFIHYDVKKHWSLDAAGGLVVRDEEIAKCLDRDLRYLATVLQPEEGSSGTIWKGFAFIFLDPGWLNLLHATDGMTMAGLSAQLSHHRQKIVELLARNIDGFANLFQLVMADQLVGLLQTLRRQMKGDKRYSQWLTGDPNQLRYDSAKVVESMIRIAHIGRNVPILRFDDDVIFSGCRRRSVDEAQEAVVTRCNVIRLCERHKQLSEDAQIGYFIFSGGYADPDVNMKLGDAVQDPSVSADTLVNCFATRVVQTAEVPKGSFREEDLAIVDVRKASKFLSGLVGVGANPFGQVISGAGLCLSDSAVIDLPPFSNMRLHVMWIDDHLKYALHHELGHFGIRRRTHHTARLPNVSFAQSRHVNCHDGVPTLNDVKWHLQTYMIRLILGCVADSWLRESSELKVKLKEQTDQAYEDLMTNVPGPYAAALFGAVLSGSSKDKSAMDRLRDTLWQAARVRLRSLDDLWSSDDFHGTFLELFMKSPAGRPDRRFDDYLPVKMREGFKEAFNHLPKDRPNPRLAKTYDAAQLPLGVAISVLIEDFLEYLDFVIFWRHFVSSVRLLLNLRLGREEVLWMVPPELQC